MEDAIPGTSRSKPLPWIVVDDRVRKTTAAWKWDTAWTREAAAPDLVRGGKLMAARLAKYVHSRGMPIRTVADFGCGPAVTLFELSGLFPSWDCWGFDSSRPVLKRNESMARRERRANLHFAFARLPEVPRRRFDLVICLATLHYLEAPLESVRALWRSVNEGGLLVMNYPNRYTRAWYVRWTQGDPEREARFSRLLEGRNLLTHAALRSQLGRQPINLWTAVGEQGRRENPCVAIWKR